MKNFPFKTIILLMIFFACQNDDIIEIEETLSNKTETLDKNLTTGTREFSDITIISPFFNNPTELLENKMQWAAFLTAEAILYDVNAANQFNIRFDSISKTVKLSDLLIHNGIGIPHFRNAFREQFEFFDSGAADTQCNDGTRKPRGGPSLPDAAGGTCGGCDPNNPDPTSNFEKFVSYLIDQNCLEFYLPNGYNPFDREFTSSAHPLNNELFNEAFELPFDCSNNAEFVISNFTLNNFENVIIVRPVKTLLGVPNDPCFYPEYSDIDLTNFLSN